MESYFAVDFMHFRSHHHPRGRAWMAGIRYVQVIVILLGLNGGRPVSDPADSIHVLLDTKVNVRCVKRHQILLMSFLIC